jgi:predicted DNA-binding protein YlxM (UPF0122 family)/AraC-like DNA-binding protein
MTTINERQAEITAAVAAGDITLQEIANRAGVSRQRIDQIMRTLPQSQYLDLRLRLEANRAQRKGVTAWGETKTCDQWVRDPRCMVGHERLDTRLRSGWDPAEALSLPAGAQRPSLARRLPAEASVRLRELTEQARGVRCNMPAGHPARVAALARDALVRELAEQQYTHRLLAQEAGVSIYAVRQWLSYTSGHRKRYKSR